MRLSKSRYVTGLQCPKILWMNEHMPEQFDESVLDEDGGAGNDCDQLDMIELTIVAS